MKQSEMQKLDILDFFMGRRVSKKFPQLLEFGEVLRDMIKYTTKKDTVKKDGDYKIDFPSTHPNFEYMSSIRNMLNQDKVLTGFYKSFFHYINSDSRNYILSKPLATALASTKTDIKCSYIPRNINGYVEIPDLYDADGEKILGIFFHTKDYPGERGDNREITIGYIVLDKKMNTPTPCMLNVFFKDTDLLKDVVKKFPYMEVNYLKASVDQPAELSNFMATIINSLIYIFNTSEKLTEEINDFTGSKKAKQRQMNMYTSAPYTYVGRGFSLPKSFGSEHIVSGHFKWQRHGVGNLLVKHIYVDPYPRNREQVQHEVIL